MWANQWEPGRKSQDAFDCYCAHFGKSPNHVNVDIAAVDKSTIPDHNLLVGGFPCQDYSVARTGATGIQGKKGVLWWQIYDVLKTKHPSFVLLENVDRLLKSPASQRGRDFGIILSCFDSEGYSVEWRVVNAAEYGFAQRRRRTFIFAYRNDTQYGTSGKDVPVEEILGKSGFLHRRSPSRKSRKSFRRPLKAMILQRSPKPSSLPSAIRESCGRGPSSRVNQNRWKWNRPCCGTLSNIAFLKNTILAIRLIMGISQRRQED